MVIRVRSPLADVAEAQKGSAVRSLPGVEGLRVGLLWNQHASSVAFWPVLERIVEEQLHPAHIRRLYKSSSWNAVSGEEIDDFARDIDFAVIGVGGCGSCTTATVRDGVNVLKAGRPAVVLVHEPFERLARIQFDIQGVLDVPGISETPILVYERDLVDRDDDGTMRRKAEDVIDRLTGTVMSQGRVLAR